MLFLVRSAFQSDVRFYNIMIIFLAGIYGYVVECVQETWVSNRSFDVFDILADLVGSIIGILIWAWAKKNKPL